tara:strand:+ start:10 stop:549 length:540 start_codon:yes stop_codon:yes gene_type:complete
MKDINKIVLDELFFHYGYIKNIDNKKLIKHIKSHGIIGSKDETDTFHEDTSFPMHPELQKLFDIINKRFSKQYKGKLKPTRFWSQIHLPNQSTTLHDHVVRENISISPVFSGVYYLQTDPESGYFVFQYSKNKVTYNRWKIKPEVGKFILFPSYIDHYVTRNYSSKNRISISFNFSVDI